MNSKIDLRLRTNKQLNLPSSQDVKQTKEVETFRMEKKGNLKSAQSICTNKGHLSSSWVVYFKAGQPQGTLGRGQLNVADAVSRGGKSSALYCFFQACCFPRNVRHPDRAKGKLARLDLLTLCLKRCFSWVDLTSDLPSKSPLFSPWCDKGCHSQVSFQPL